MLVRLLLLFGALVLGTGLCSACTPGSSHSSPADTPDTEMSASGAASSARRSPEEASPPTDAEPRSVSQRLADASVAARATQALARHQTLRRFDFSPSAVRGHLTLRGDVNTREQYREAARTVAALSSVQTVTNAVTIDGRRDPEASASSASNTAHHTVRRGDTLSEIARRYGVSVRQLRSLNDLSASLQPGEHIRVR
ncbi:LysM peptidoglycan-binding domain-containing protein [Salinibacter altiplanensis]|uniref:LysM peptidoglycan-binding domain-containing protein n=1 Tax=Salinibacter altiplanensis TaxID=1803181 RepID=UPI000C9F2F75|nr:LysM peptidoglycan-binding domain-containing protein [Salinibacter altiplanensis]